MQRRHFLAAAAATWATVSVPASAQVAHAPLRIILPTAAGGTMDVSVRRMAAVLEAELGTIHIDNRPEDGGIAGMAEVAHAPADGLTLGIASVTTHAIYPWLSTKLPYNPIKDFAPITQMARIPNVLLVNAEAAQQRDIASFADFLAYAQRTPTPLRYASAGPGTAGHLAGALLQHETQLRLVHMPFPGGASSLQALLSGQVDCAFDNLASAAASLRSGKLLALAVTTAQRSELLPELPAIAETVEDFAIATWWGLVAPAGTPADLVQRLNTLTVRALHSPEVISLYRMLMMETVTSTPDAFGGLLRHQLIRYGELVRLSRATVG